MTYHINNYDGHDHRRVTRTLDEVKAAVDNCIDIPYTDIRIYDDNWNVVAIRRWHKAPVSEESNPSACLDFGYYGHYGPWDESSETLAQITREDTESIARIMDNLRAGLRYGQFRHNAHRRMYSTNLILSEDGRFIHYRNYGESAIKATARDLLWLITVIFKTTPAAFVKEYDAYTFEQELTASRTGKPIASAA